MHITFCKAAMALLLALGSVSAEAEGNTFHVHPDGDDSNPGTLLSPWRTISRASGNLMPGDTVIIADGDYEEYVHETNSGVEGRPIRYQAANPAGAALRGFRLSGQHIELRDLTVSQFRGEANTWASAVRIEPNAHHSVIRGCRVIDGVYAIAHDFRFDAADSRISSPSSDFLKAGFARGSRIYLGASGMDGLWYTNHNTAWIITDLSKNSLWVETAQGERLRSDPGSNYWAAVHVGTGSQGPVAFNMVLSGGKGATNVTFSGNTVSNWFGAAFSINGRGNVVEQNHVTRISSYRFLSFSGDNHIIRSNIVRDLPNIIHYTQPELAMIPHPAGTGWYDYQVGMLSGFTVSVSHNTNILIEGNWFENIENQLGRVDDGYADTHGVIYRGNVFIGVTAHFSGGRDDMQWVANTFYRCLASFPLSVGGRPPQHTGYIISHNLFVDCGRYDSFNRRGFYSVSTNAVDPLLDYNMVAAAEVTGYSGKLDFLEENGINGGDPVFLDAWNPAGADNIPFTADDGLQVLPNSPAASIGGGALGVYRIREGQPVAHFRITSPLGWFEPTGDDYDLEWLAMLPTQRSRVVRPYDTPPSLGQVPVEVTFDAEQSISGVGGAITHAAISQFIWNFDDGRLVTNGVPSVAHVFDRAGDVIVRLTVVNTEGNSHTAANRYRLAAADVGSPNDELGPPLRVRFRE